jgi:hypothetical protein
MTIHESLTKKGSPNSVAVRSDNIPHQEQTKGRHHNLQALMLIFPWLIPQLTLMHIT